MEYLAGVFLAFFGETLLGAIFSLLGTLLQAGIIWLLQSTVFWVAASAYGIYTGIERINAAKNNPNLTRNQTAYEYGFGTTEIILSLLPFWGKFKRRPKRERNFEHSETLNKTKSMDLNSAKRTLEGNNAYEIEEGIQKKNNLAGIYLGKNKFKFKAEELISRLSKIETKVTQDLKNLAKANGGKMEGLEFRLKTPESLERKLASDGINEPMNDVLRYTIIIDDDLAKGTSAILKGLESKGYQTVKIKNTFQKGQIYKGINTNVKTPDGNIFEIQYHTSESFNVKQNINHSLYEEYRLLDKTSQEAINLEKRMIENSNTIKLPQNINKIKSY